MVIVVLAFIEDEIADATMAVYPPESDRIYASFLKIFDHIVDNPQLYPNCHTLIRKLGKFGYLPGRVGTKITEHCMKDLGWTIHTVHHGTRAASFKRI